MRLQHWTRFASTVGDGTGTSDFIGKYDVVPVRGLLIPTAGEAWDVHRLIIRVEDDVNMRAADYGTLGAPLTNGIEIHVETKGGSETIDDLTEGFPIKSNGDWAGLCYDADVKSWRTGGAGNEFLVVRYTFTRMGGPITLENDDQIAIDFSDDFTGLIAHTFMFQGVRS